MVTVSNGTNSDQPPSGAANGFRRLLQEHPSIQLTEDHIQSILSVRRGRELLFGQRLFSDPAWDILLELCAAELGGRDLVEADLARTIGAPASVIKRWIAALIEAKLVSISDEKSVSLTPAGASNMLLLGGRWASAFVAI